MSSLQETIHQMGRQARAAAYQLAQLSSDEKNAILRAMAAAIREATPELLEANARDIAAGTGKGLSAAMLDRLRLDEKRIEAMAAGIDQVATLPDPVGQVLEKWTRPNGIEIEQIRVPIGTIGIIYESRPNVTVDAAVLCVRAGNATLLRGGSEAIHSNRALLAALIKGLMAGGVPADAVQLMPTQDRAAVGAMLQATGLFDMIIPRGGKSLVARVQADARVPVLAHLDGICHTYIHPSADVAMARTVALNAKMRRTGICGAAECLLIDRGFWQRHGGVLLEDLIAAGVEVRAEGDLLQVAGTVPANPEDFGREFLDMIMAARIVDGVDGAIAHIRRYGSSHTESILTENDATAARFFQRLDSAILMRNASTQFADGGEFGMGAEIGIATGKMHARGPVGVEQLTSFKYRVRGSGQTRP